MVFLINETKKENGGPQNYFKDDRNWKPHHIQRQYNNTFFNGLALGIFNAPLWGSSMGLQISRDFQSGEFTYHTLITTGNLRCQNTDWPLKGCDRQHNMLSSFGCVHNY